MTHSRPIQQAKAMRILLAWFLRCGRDSRTTKQELLLLECRRGESKKMFDIRRHPTHDNARAGQFRPSLFSGGGGAISLADSASTTLNYTYTPTGHNPDSQNVQVALTNGSNDGTNSAENLNGTISGTGVGPEFGTSSHSSSLDNASNPIDFGEFPADSTFDVFITLDNTTTDTVPLIDIELVQLSLTSVEPVTVPFSLVGSATGVIDPLSNQGFQVRFDRCGPTRLTGCATT